MSSNIIVINLNLLYVSARASKRLTFLYLANDIIQNSKKKGPEFHRDFKPVLKEAFLTSTKYAQG